MWLHFVSANRRSDPVEAVHLLKPHQSKEDIKEWHNKTKKQDSTLQENYKMKTLQIVKEFRFIQNALMEMMREYKTMHCGILGRIRVAKSRNFWYVESMAHSHRAVLRCFKAERTRPRGDWEIEVGWLGCALCYQMGIARHHCSK